MQLPTRSAVQKGKKKSPTSVRKHPLGKWDSKVRTESLWGQTSMSREENQAEEDLKTIKESPLKKKEKEKALFLSAAVEG